MISPARYQRRMCVHQSIVFDSLPLESRAARACALSPAPLVRLDFSNHEDPWRAVEKMRLLGFHGGGTIRREPLGSQSKNGTAPEK